MTPIELILLIVVVAIAASAPYFIAKSRKHAQLQSIAVGSALLAVVWAAMVVSGVPFVWPIAIVLWGAVLMWSLQTRETR